MFFGRTGRFALAGLATLLVVSAAARAETITASATTIVSGRQDPRDGTVHTVVPFLELLTLEARGLQNPALDNMNVVFSGWAEATAGEPRDGKSLLGDVDLAYVEGSRWHGRAGLRLGRQLVSTGTTAPMQIDGISPRVRLGRGFGATAFFGAPVTPRFEFDRGDWTAGARAHWRHSVESEVGVSFLELHGDGQLGRRDAGLDARFRVLRSLVLSALGRFSLPEARLAEADFAATWQPHHKVEVTGDVRRTAPDLFLPRYSIFSVFAQDRRDEAGGFLSLRPCRSIEIVGDWHAINEDEGWGSQGGLRAAFRLRDAGWTRLGAEVRRLDVAGGGYVMGRLTAWRRLTTKLGAGADVQAYDMERPLNGQTRSYTATASAVYDYSPSWRVVVTGVGNVTPFVKHGYEGLLKVVYNHGRTFVQEER